MKKTLFSALVLTFFSLAPNIFAGIEKSHPTPSELSIPPVEDLAKLDYGTPITINYEQAIKKYRENTLNIGIVRYSLKKMKRGQKYILATPYLLKSTTRTKWISLRENTLETYHGLLSLETMK